MKKENRQILSGSGNSIVLEPMSPLQVIVIYEDPKQGNWW
jgi:hypothetical protein